MSSVLERFQITVKRDSYGNPEPTAQRERIQAALLIFSVFVIGTIDYFTGPHWSMLVFYVIPTAIGAVIAGRTLGLTLAFLGGTASLFANVILLPHYRYRAHAAWYVLFLICALVVVVEVIHRTREMAAAAIRAEDTGREFLAVVAHQLRTPLAGIRATAEALTMTENLNDEQKELLRALVSEAERSGRLVHSLLQVARLDQHEPVPLQLVDLRYLAEGEVDRAALAWPSLTWIFVAPDDPVMAACNTEALAEAIANLLDNAHRHSVGQIRLTVQETASYAQIVIEDDGPGLGADSVDVAFGRFVTLDNHGGTGLGLPIARGIAIAHGGTLDYEDRSFVISLPVRASARQPRPSRGPERLIGANSQKVLEPELRN